MHYAPEPVDLKKKEKHEIIDWLAKQFPAAFFKRAKHIKPLKIGILDDLFEVYLGHQQKPYSKKSIRSAIHYYCSSPAYLNAQKKGTARVDLYGNEMDVVTYEQEKYAKLKFKSIYVFRNASV